jgi:diguanylate cyclase (GGDEF)-like protein
MRRPPRDADRDHPATRRTDPNPVPGAIFVTDRPRSSASPDAILATAISSVARAGGIERVLDDLLAAAIDAVGADRGSVVLWDGERGRLTLAASVGYSTQAAATYEETVATSTDHPVARTAHGQTAILGAEGPAEDGTTTVTATWPLRVSSDGVEEPLGALAVSRPGPWIVGEGDASLLAAFGDLIAIAVDRARLAAAAQRQADWQEQVAHTDALTGLANARTLSRILELEIARASRQGTELSVAIFDVDGLGGANAAGGPAVGDDILREVAAVLAESVRLVDTVGRWGGDEFLVVAPGAAGMTVARRVLDAVAGRPEISGRSFTVSAGVARFPADGASSEELVRAAGDALQGAKSSGPGAMAAAESA